MTVEQAVAAAFDMIAAQRTEGTPMTEAENIADDIAWHHTAEIQATDSDEATISALTFMLAKALVIIADAMMTDDATEA